MAKRLFNGITVDTDQIAFDVVKKVGPGGNFLGEPHTFQHFREEIWTPDTSERRSYEEWEADGAKDFKVVIREKLVDILNNHKPEALSDDILAKLDAIVDREEAYIAGK